MGKQVAKAKPRVAKELKTNAAVVSPSSVVDLEPVVIPPRADLPLIIGGHSRFWMDAKYRVQSRAKLPPLSPRYALPQPITAALPRNPLPAGSPRPKPDFVF